MTSFAFAITGPKPPPGALYRQTRDRALRELETREGHTSTACPDCRSGLWDNEVGYCPSCGFSRTYNGHPVTPDQRSWC